MFRDTPGFARVFGYSEKPVGAIFMEYYHFGSLEDYIVPRKKTVIGNQFPYTKIQLVKLLLDCSKAYNAMHEKGVVHCDIKPANVLLKLSDYGMLNAVITDFGVARLLSSRNV